MLQGDPVASVRDSVADGVEGALRIVDGHVLQHRCVPHKGVVPMFHLCQAEEKLRLRTFKSRRRSVLLEMGQFQLFKGSEVLVPNCCQHQRCPDAGAMRSLG